MTNMAPDNRTFDKRNDPNQQRQEGAYKDLAREREEAQRQIDEAARLLQSNRVIQVTSIEQQAQQIKREPSQTQPSALTLGPGNLSKAQSQAQTVNSTANQGRETVETSINEQVSFSKEDTLGGLSRQMANQKLDALGAQAARTAGSVHSMLDQVAILEQQLSSGAGSDAERTSLGRVQALKGVLVEVLHATRKTQSEPFLTQREYEEQEKRRKQAA